MCARALPFAVSIAFSLWVGSSLQVRGDSSFQTIIDITTGVRVALPVDVLTQESPTKRGRNWSSKDRGISIDTLAFGPDQSLESVYATLNSIKGRSVNRSELNATSFVLEGRDASGSNFYVAVHRKDDIIRGLSVVITPQKIRDHSTIIKRITQSFEPFPSTTIPPSVTPSEATSVPTIASQDSLGRSDSVTPVEVVPNIGTLTGFINATFSPDGQILATTGGYFVGRVKLWHIGSGRLLHTLEYFAYFEQIAFSPNGELIVSGHRNGDIKLWKTLTGSGIATLRISPRKQHRHLEEYESRISSVWFDPAGELLVTGDATGAISIWNVEHQKQINNFKTKGGVVAARLSSDRHKLIVLTGTTITIFEVQTAKAIVSFKLPDRHEFSEDSIVDDDDFVVRFSSDDCEIAELKFLNLKDRRNLRTIEKPPACKRPTKDDETDYEYGNPTIFVLPEHQQIMIARRGNPNLKLWNLRSQQIENTITTFQDIGGDVLALSKDTKFAALHRTDRIAIFELGSGKLLKELTTFGYEADNAIASSDGFHVLLSHETPSESKQKDLHMWQTEAVKPLNISIPTEHDIEVYDFASSSRTVLAVDSDGRIVLFSADTGREIRRFSVPGISSVSTSRLSPDGKLILLIGEDRRGNAIALVDALTGKVKFTLKDKDEDKRVNSIVFSADGSKFVLGRFNGVAEVWTTQTFQRLKVLPATNREFGDTLLSVSLSNDGRYLVAGGRDEGVHIWSMATGRPIRLSQDDNLAGYVTVQAVAVSRDSQLIAGGLSQRATASYDIGSESGTVKVWDVATGKLRFSLRGHQRGVRAVVFSADDKRIISASYDGTIRYWDRTDGKWLATFSTTESGRWIVMTERGFFAGSVGSDDLITVVRGLDAYSVSQFRRALYRPDLVETLLKGDPERKYKDAAHNLNLWEILNSGPAPQIELSPERQIERAGDTVRVTVRVTDTGGGINEDVVWRVNNIEAGSPQSGAISAEEKAQGYRVLTETLRVNPRQKNVIEVNAYNARELLASESLRIVVDPFGFSTEERPRMFVIAVGISNYVREDWRLQYAATDAKAFADQLKATAAGLYEDIKIQLVPEERATREGISAAFNEIRNQVRATDVFVLFVAGHGRTVDSTGTYYFYPRDLTFDGGRSVEDGIGQATWQSWLKQIAAQKSILIFDTCESSGAAGLTRGTSEREAAIDRLRDATGRSVITAARQAAYEGYHGRGVLTYAILDALTSKDGHEHEVDLYQLAAQVDRDVPEISQRLFGVRQRPHNKIEGNFPIGMAKAIALTATDASPEISSVPTHVLVRAERVRELPTADAPGDRELGAGVQVRVVEFIGDWAIVARDGQKMGYLPAKVLLKLQ